MPDGAAQMGTTKTLAVVVISHQRAPLAVLEQVSLDTPGCATLARALTQCEGVAEAAVLSTCNRTELYLAGSAPDTDAALDALVAQSGTSRDFVNDCVWQASGQHVAMHLFRVAAGLESRVTGEREILGQVRSAIATSREAGIVGSRLDCLFRTAIAVGRRVQQSDPSSPTLLPQIGLDAARPDHTQPAGLTMVMGAGQMAAETVRELVGRGMDYVVCARRVERAALLARRPDQVASFDRLAQMLELAEVVVCATGARTPLLSAADIESAMQRRAGRPLVIVDLSLPRNVDPLAGQVPGVRLLDLEDLVSGSSVVELRRRTDIIDDEFRRFGSWLAGQRAGHLIAQLHAGVHDLCRQAIAASFAEGAQDSPAIAVASHRIAGRLLHLPTLAIKALMAEGDERAAGAVLTSFGLSGWTSTVDSAETSSATCLDEARSMHNRRAITLVARSGRRCGEVGRVPPRQGPGAKFAS